MSVEVTDEIKAKFWEAAAWPGPNDLDVHRGLAAVLEIVEREHEIEVSKLRGALTMSGNSRELWKGRAIAAGWKKP